MNRQRQTGQQNPHSAAPVRPGQDDPRSSRVPGGKAGRWPKLALALALIASFTALGMCGPEAHAQDGASEPRAVPVATEPYTAPRISIADRSEAVTLSWTPQPSPTEIVTGATWSLSGALIGAVAATDKDFNLVTDAGSPSGKAAFDLPKRSAMALFMPKAAAAQASADGLRLDGTFIQYQSWMKTLDATAWQKELETMRRARLRLLFIQWLQYNQTRFFPADNGANDATEIILSFADRQGMQVFLGLAMDDGWWNKSADANYLQATADTSGKIADEIWQRYGKHPSLAGWYIPQETWDGSYTDAQTTALRSFFRRVSDHCKQLSGGKPVSFAPFFSGSVTPDAMGIFYKKLLDGAGLDILLLQDGVGAQGWDTEVADRVTPCFRALRNACLTTGVAFWSDLESFHLASADPLRFTPADIGRLCQQLAVEAPFVQHVITFDFFHYLSPYRGLAQKQFDEDYLKTCVDRPFFPTFGRSVEIDPQFGYYRDRSPSSIASEIRANGYSIVRYILTADSAVRPELIAAFHREGIGVWYATFANGTYSTRDLPSGWQAWKMVTRSDLEGTPLQDGYTRLCPNNLDYRAWKKAQMGRMLQEHPFQGIDIMEPHWPEYPGVESPAYACFCGSCLKAFGQQYPGEGALPDILTPDSPRSPARNPTLWRKWIEFRHRSLAAFLDDLVNGERGVRAAAPLAPVCVWTLALSETNGLQRVLEVHGEDPGEIARVVKPDLLCLQTHWPDWTRADLASNYVLKYGPFVQAVRAAAPDLPIMIQADTGSQRQNRRSWSWIRAFERACAGMGVQNTTFYEYFIGNYMYTDPPQIVAQRQAGGEIELQFTKRLDPKTAGDTSHYQLSSGRVRAVQGDGNRVLLATEGMDARVPNALVVRGLTDDGARRLYSDRPATTLAEQTLRLR